MLKALDMEPDNARAHIDLANVLRAGGKLDDAMVHYLKALDLEPDHAGAHINLGNILRVRGRLDEAVAHYLKALDIEPNNAGAHINLGSARRAVGRLDDAIVHYGKALDIEPDNAAAHLNLANVLQARGELDDAAAHYERALGINPNHAAARINLGNIRQAQGKFDDAIANYKKARPLDPGNAALYNHLGWAILGAHGDLNDAVACFERALALEPNYAEAHYNLGNVLGDQGRLDEAVGCYERALTLKPDYADAHTNLIVTLRDQGRIDDAMACSKRALAFYPDSADMHFCDAYFRLLTGDFAEGWRNYEWRWLTKEVESHGIIAPLWDGKNLRGRTIHLHCEQGLGDSIQCVRFARSVKDKDGIVLLSSPPSLARLFENVAGIDGVSADGRDLPGYDVHAPLMSLPGLFQTTLETIPADVPYLQADRARVAVWRDLLAGYHGFRVGIAWRGRPTHKDDRKRSMTAAQFTEFLNIPGLAVVSLQKDGTADEIETLGKIPGPFFDAGPLLEDFCETASAMANLDLVITVDTSVCHLAGALAAPVWTLIPFAPDWRWLLQREDSPWYPTMRLLRQPKIGDWQSVVGRVRDELARVAEKVGKNRPQAGEADGTVCPTAANSDYFTASERDGESRK